MKLHIYLSMIGAISAVVWFGPTVWAGSFEVTTIIYHDWDLVGNPEARRIIVEAEAEYVGPKDANDYGWLLNSFLTDDSGSNNDTAGYGLNGTGVWEGRRITTGLAYGADAVVPLCNGTLNNHYQGRGAVTIYHQFNPEIDELSGTRETLYCDPVGGETPPGPGGGDNQQTCPNSPILLDLGKDGFHLTGLLDPVRFDLDADGRAELVAWTQAGETDAFLAFDRNGNGRIDDGSELFGDHTPLVDGSLAPHGYAALAEFDSPALGGNRDGVVDRGDGRFGDLLLWIDQDHDGRSEPGEILTLEQAAVLAIALDYVENRRRDRWGNEFRYNSRAMMASRKAEVPIKTSDVFFVVAPW